MASIKIELSEKVILLTGGYGHLGKGIAENLALHGGKVFVAGRSYEKFKKAFKNSIENIEFLQCDIGKEGEVRSAAGSIFESEGKFDAVINNAFYSRGQDPENMTSEDWAFGIDGNLNCVFRSIKEVLPILKKNQSGKIINVSSMYGMLAPDFGIYDEYQEYLNPPHYGAAKAGVIQLTKYYAGYLGKHNIMVNCVSPGPFPSKAVQEASPGFIQQLSRKTALNRIGIPSDIGGIFTFLVSDASNFVTGQNFVIDGGWTIKS
ncbi:gluconate 5-dehydrogenase [Ekhidna lutea]|uniref:Gluconate 5-dehydrogenase n=1 Tax=Ekhidna lutea TaxID=447679 RepID=A0A239FIW9_EKHLU|nr:SDR family oxidoreductase [Ekhidna lutea]SNS56142.1 gluconate 5-dehydrogenase [Ekhidna lutea]